jgi:hypothetical protein
VTTIRLSIGATVTTRPERNAFKALKLAAPFMRWKHSPPTTDEAQAVAYAVLALTLAPYVDGLDAPALGDARDGGAGAYGGGGNSDSRFYDRTFVYSPTNHYATAPSDQMDYMTARPGRQQAGARGAPREPWRANRAPTEPLPISVIKFHQAIIVVAIQSWLARSR